MPGLVAKPILDTAVGLQVDADPSEATSSLQAYGFLPRAVAEGDRLDRNFGLQLEDRVRLVNAHLVRYGEREWNAYLRFRDQLRADPGARDQYARIKINLARSFPTERMPYLDGKTEFVRQTIDRSGQLRP